MMFQSDFAAQAGKDCKRRDVMQMFLASGAVHLPNRQGVLSILICQFHRQV